MEIIKSLGLFIFGILKRIYWLLPLLLSDPFDVLGKWGVNWVVPQWIIWCLTGVGFFIASFLTYNELRVSGNKTQKEWEYKRKLIKKQRESTNLKNILGLLNKMRTQTQEIAKSASIVMTSNMPLKDIFSNMMLYADRESKRWLSQTTKENYNEQRLFLLEMTNAMEASDYGLSKLKQRDNDWLLLEETLNQYRPDYLIDTDLTNYINDYLRFLNGFGNYMLYRIYHDKCTSKDLEKELGEEFVLNAKRKAVGANTAYEHILDQLFKKVNKRVNELLRGDEAK